MANDENKFEETERNEAPEVTNEAPEVASEAPKVAEEAPKATNEAPEAKNEAPKAPEEAPKEATPSEAKEEEKNEKKTPEAPADTERSTPEAPAATDAKAKEKGKRPKKEKKPKKERRLRKKHPVLRVCGAFLRFILTLLLGMAIAYGSLVGIFYYAFSGLTIDVLQRFGIAKNADTYLSENGEVDLTGTSILELIADFNSIRADLKNHTVQSLIDHYGIMLPEETLAKLPTDLFSVPLDQLTSGDVGAVIASNLKFGYILSLLPPAMVGENLRNILGDRPLSLLTSGAYGELFSGVKLGYLTGISFDENGNVQYADATHPTLQEVMATLDLGKVLSAAAENGDLLGVFATDIGNSELRPLLTGIIDGALLDKMCEGLYIKDVLLPDEETGRYRFELEALTGGLCLGDVLGYKEINGTWYSKYTDNGDATDDEVASKMHAALAVLSLSDVIGGKLVLDDSFGDLYFGDLQSGYVRGEAITEEAPDGGDPVVIGYEWQKDGAPVGKMQQELANIAVTDLLNGKLDINATLGTLRVGDMQGYIYRELTDSDTGEVIGHKWYKLEGDAEVEVSPVLSAVADISVSSMLEGELDLVAALGDLKLGDVQGYTLGTDGLWYQEVADGEGTTLQYVGAVQNSIANVELSAVMNGEFSLTTATEGLLMGEAMGYLRGDVITPADPADPTSRDKYAFTKKDNTEVTGTMLEMANLPLSDVLNGDVDFEDTVRDMTLAEALDLTAKEDGWYDEDGKKVTGVLAVLAEKRINEINNATIDAIAFGEILGYTYEDTDENGTPDTWFDGELPAEGMMATLASLTLGDLSNDETVAEKLRELTLADAMGYELDENDVWRDQDGNELTGVLKVLAGKPLNRINAAAIEDIFLGDAIGYTYNEEDDTWYQGTVAATGIMAKMADLTVGELKNSSLVADKLAEVELFEVLDYKKVGNQWQNKEGEPASGVISYLLETPVGSIEQKINEMPLGYAFGFHYDADDEKWYTNATDKTEPTGITASFVNIHLGNAKSELEVMQLGDLLGYTHKDTDEDGTPDTWYDKNDPVGGLNLVLVDLFITDLGNEDKISGAMQKATLGSSLGFKKVKLAGDKEARWYKTKLDPDGKTVVDKDNPVTGLIGALADQKIGGLEDEIDTVKIGTMLEFTENSGTWYDKDGDPVTGALAVLARSDLGSISDNVKNMTVADMWPDGERTGILKAISGTTKISELDTAVESCTVDTLISEGVIEVGTLQARFFDEKMPEWRTYGAVKFINEMLKLDVFSLGH